MCLAVYGRIMKLEPDQRALADFEGIPLMIDLGLVDAGVGDVVLIHAGCAIAVQDEQEYLRWRELMAEIDGLNGETGL